MASAAAGLERKPPKRQCGPVGYAFTPIPQRFFRDNARNLTHCQLLVVGLVQELATDAGTEDVPINAKRIAEYIGQTERNVASTLADLQSIGVIRSRRVGRHVWAYGFDRESLAKLQVREPRKLVVENKGKSGARTEVGFSPFPCPKDGLPCPEVGESADGGLVRLSRAFVENKGKTEARPEVGFRTQDRGSRRRQILDLLLARFGNRLATVPTDEMVARIQRNLGGATLEHFDYLMTQKAAKVTGWGFMLHLASDCNRAKVLWTPARAPRAGLACRDCGERSEVLDDRRCPACAQKANAVWRVAQSASGGAG
jgi:hypothetical protein